MINPQQPDYSNTPASSRRPRLNPALVDSSAAPLVSIITSLLNVAENLRETALSVRQQSLQQWEWILVGDSPNASASAAVMAEIFPDDPRIRIVDLAKTGTSGAALNA